MQLPLADLPEFPPRHRIGIKQRGLILRPDGDGPLAWSWARWSLVPPGAKEPPAYPLNNARSDKLGTWPWKAVQRQRCLVPASGFWEPEKPARAPGARLVLLQHAGRPTVLPGSGSFRAAFSWLRAARGTISRTPARRYDKPRLGGS